MKSIDLNADLGEGCADDTLIMPYISSANIACAAHAGDEQTIHRTIEAALAANLAIGAHPGYEDRENFGRKPLHLPDNQLRSSIETQLSRFLLIADKLGATVHHVKPHGALYNKANQNQQIASILAHTIAALIPHARIYCPPNGELSVAAAKHKILPTWEGFADRRYLDDASLMPRNLKDAVIHDIPEATHQALLIAKHHKVITANGTTIPIMAQTLCVHGDHPNALQLIRSIHNSLRSEKISIRKP